MIPALRSWRLAPNCYQQFVLLLRVCRWILPLVIGLTFASTCQAQQTVKELNVKGVYLWHFTKFITWPDNAFADAKAPLVIGVYGKHDYGKILDSISRRVAGKGRRIRVEYYPTLQQIRPCHLLFVPQQSSEQIPAIAAQIRGPTAIVGESPGDATRGALLEFFRDVTIEGVTIGFRINTKVLKQRNLKANARLLKLADIVP